MGQVCVLAAPLRDAVHGNLYKSAQETWGWLIHQEDEDSSEKMSTGASAQKLDQLPAEMLEFTVLKASTWLAQRVGRLSVPGRNKILTPGFIGNTSRGVIPHISQDNFQKCVDLGGVYVPLEDCG